MDDDTKDSGSMQNEASKPGSSSRGAADDVKENVKETVAKGVAAVAGALKGFSEEAKKHDLAGSAKQAVQKAGEATRELAGTAKQEFRQTKEHLKGGGASSSAMGDPMGGTSSGSSSTSTSASSGMSSVPDLRKTPLGTQSDIKDKTAPSSVVSGSTFSKKEEDDDASPMNDSH